jgi:hypothetical protein
VLDWKYASQLDPCFVPHKYASPRKKNNHIEGSIRSQERGLGSKVGWCVSVPRLKVFVGFKIGLRGCGRLMSSYPVLLRSSCIALCDCVNRYSTVLLKKLGGDHEPC